MIPNQIDHINKQILEILNENARFTFATIAERIGVSATTVADRIKKMEEMGIITGYKVALNPEALGMKLPLFIHLKITGRHFDQALRAMENIDSITECYRVTGDECFLIRVQLSEIGELETLVDRLSSYGEVKSSLVLSTPIRRMIPIRLDGDN